MSHNQTTNLRPIRIPSDALDGGLPTRDLTVSPQHRVLVWSRIARRMFRQEEVLVAAKHLVGTDGIAVAPVGEAFEYWPFMSDSHQVIFSEGATTESLLIGPEALARLGDESRREIMGLLPQLSSADFVHARTFVNGRMGRTLAMRHQKNQVALCAS